MKFYLFLSIFILLAILSISALNFNQVLEYSDNITSLQVAKLNLEISQNSYSLIASKGDFNFKLTPEVQTQSDFLSGEINIDLDIIIPLLYTAQEEIEKTQALENVKIAQEYIDQEEAYTVSLLYSLYSKAYLAKEEVKAKEFRLQALEAQYNNAFLRFKQGSESYNDISKLEMDLSTARQELLQTQMNQRISWYQLSSVTGMDPYERPELESPDFSLSDLPQVSELNEWINKNHYQIIAAEKKINDLKADLTLLPGVNISPVVKASFNAPDNAFNGSVSMNFTNGDLTASGGLPVYSYGEASTSTASQSQSNDTWSISLNMDIGLSGGSETSLKAEAIKLQIKNEHIKLEELKQNLNFSLRSNYQKYQIAKQMIESAEQSLAAAKETMTIVSQRVERGTLTPTDALSAEADYEQASFNFKTAQQNYIISALNTASGADYLSEFLGGKL